MPWLRQGRGSLPPISMAALPNATAQAIGDVALGFVCDVADRGQCDVLSAEVRQRVGAISILVNNAGIIRRGAVTEPNARQDWDATMAVNLDGPTIW